MAHGEYNHIEIPADDLQRAQRFYSELFGWKVESTEGFPDYLVYRTGGEGSLGGGIGKRGESAGQQTRNYIEVDSLDEALKKVEQLGGSVKQPRMDIGGDMGFFAVATDSEGNEIALYENAPGK